MTTEPPGTPAGWHPDPYDPTQLRYWDGETWTEHTHRYEAHGAGTSFSSAGQVLNAAFVTLGRRWKPVILLALITLIPGPVVLWFGLEWIIGGTLLDFENTRSGSVESVEWIGVETGRAALLFPLAILWLLGQWLFGLAVAHQVVVAQKGGDPSVGESLQLAVLRLPRFFGWTMLIIIGFLVAAVVAVLAAVVSPILTLLLFLLLAVAGVWVSVKAAFLAIAAAVAPPSCNVLKTSAEVSAGRFWAAFGRILLVGVVAGVLYFAGTIAQGQLSAVGFGPDFEEAIATNPDGLVESVDFSRLFDGSLPLVLLGTAFGGLIQGLLTAFTSAGSARMYLDVRSPVDDELIPQAESTPYQP